MSNYRFSIIFSVVFITFLHSCSNPTVQTNPSLSGSAKTDSIKNDEINNPISHKHLMLAQRAVIRPIYVETERNVTAEHKGYLIHIKLKNAAKSVTYKDIRLEITYFSNKAEALGNEEILISKHVKPDQTLQVSNKVRRYKNTNYKVKLVSATAVDK